MTANAGNSDLHFLRLDATAILQFPEPVRRAAELLSAYVAGFDQGLRTAARAGAEAPGRLGAGPTDPGDLPDAGAVLADLTQRAEEQHSAELAAAAQPGAGVMSSICRPISGVDPDGAGDTAGPTEIVLVWGPGSARRVRDL